MSVTIRDVAAQAGVSPKTVSRVINGEAHVRPEVREAVMRVVDALDYRPNAFARGLSSARAFLIGLFFDDATSGYAADVQRGALQRCRELSYHLVVEPIDLTRADWRGKLTGTLSELRLAGAILTPPICDSDDLIELLERQGVPVVRIAPRLAPDRTASARMDDRAAARDMTATLIADGHRDIAFIKGKPDHSATPLRWAGFRDALTEAGLPIRDDRVLQGDFTFRSGLEVGELLLAHESRPTAVFAANDEMALGVLVMAMRNHIAVPEALSVVGFDDAPIARMAWPQLTTIRQPNPEIAAAAVDLLVGAGAGTKATMELPYTLLKRASSGPVS